MPQQAYQSSQYVVPRGGIFLGKWRSTFAGSSDGQINVQSACALNTLYLQAMPRTMCLHSLKLWDVQACVVPGEFWAFEGLGAVVIQLIGKVNITAVSIAHASRALLPTAAIQSAPNESLYGD
jgi:hypothetical protein